MGARAGLSFEHQIHTQRCKWEYGYHISHNTNAQTFECEGAYDSSSIEYGNQCIFDCIVSRTLSQWHRSVPSPNSLCSVGEFLYFGYSLSYLSWDILIRTRLNLICRVRVAQWNNYSPQRSSGNLPTTTFFNIFISAPHWDGLSFGGDV